MKKRERLRSAEKTVAAIRTRDATRAAEASKAKSELVTALQLLADADEKAFRVEWRRDQATSALLRYIGDPAITQAYFDVG